MPGSDSDSDYEPALSRRKADAKRKRDRRQQLSPEARRPELDSHAQLLCKTHGGETVPACVPLDRGDYDSQRVEWQRRGTACVGKKYHTGANCDCYVLVFAIAYCM